MREALQKDREQLFHMGTRKGDNKEKGKCNTKDSDEVLLKPIDDQEWEGVIQDLRNNKAMDSDKMISEFIKNGGEVAKMWLRMMCEWILKDQEIPESWRRSRTNMIHKKGDVEKLDNYRGITTSVVHIRCLQQYYREDWHVWLRKTETWGYCSMDSGRESGPQMLYTH